MPPRTHTRPDPALAAAIRDAIEGSVVVLATAVLRSRALAAHPAPARAATALTEAVAR